MTSISKSFENWQPPVHFLNIKTLDCHTGGEPLRIITSGFPELVGKTVLEKRRYCRDNFDHLRTALMFEPRGHADMYGALVVEADNPDSHFGAIFIHNEGYSTMCGHAVIALTKFAVESGLVEKTGNETAVTIDVPCGQIHAVAYGDESVENVSFECVPSFILHNDVEISLDDFGTIKLDIAYGGAFYAYLDVSQVNLTCGPEHTNELIRVGRLIKQAVQSQFDINHPVETDLGFLYGTIFIEPSIKEGIHSRNVCIFADGEVDRSPTGSGVSGRAAIHHQKGDVDLNEVITIESVLGSTFEVSAVRSLDYHGYPAVIPRVTGKAYISGKCEFFIDPDDPLKNGFILR